VAEGGKYNGKQRQMLVTDAGGCYAGWLINVASCLGWGRVV